MSMICSLCHRTGIRWMGPLSNLTHTECPHCGGMNCQQAEPEPEHDPIDVEYEPAIGRYLATRDGYEPGDVIGEGRTREEAIEDLLEREGEW